MKPAYWVIAVVIGLALGVFAYKIVTPLSPPRTSTPPSHGSEATPSSTVSPPPPSLPSTDSSEFSPAPPQPPPSKPEPPRKPEKPIVEKPSPSPDKPAPPPPPPKPSLPSRPSCGSGDPDQDLQRAEELLTSDRGRALRLFDRVVGCGGQYAMISGRLFDPTKAHQGVLPDARIAMHFYWYAGAQGRAGEARKSLEKLRDGLEGNAALVREVNALIDALGSSGG